MSYGTLREYAERGYIKPVVLETGKWRLREEDVEKLVCVVRKRKVILYARVSSNTQKDDLINQILRGHLRDHTGSPPGHWDE
jgi:predicted site-specific integrase-resolvase